jgi:hypothetical protein
MAEIRVEPKRRSLAWVWVLLALAVAAAVFWYLNNDGVNQVETTPATSALPHAAPAGAAPDGAVRLAAGSAGAGSATLARVA